MSEQDQGSVACSAEPSLASPSLAVGSAKPSRVLAPCVVSFQLGAILEQLRQNYGDQPEWINWVTETITSASHWISRAHLTSEGVASKPDGHGEAGKGGEADCLRPNQDEGSPA